MRLAMYFSPIISHTSMWRRLATALVLSKHTRPACAARAGRASREPGANIQACRIFGGLKAMTNSSPLIAIGSRRKEVRRGVNRSGFMTGLDARLWLPWLRINRVMRVMLHTRWSGEQWAVVMVEFRKAVALRGQIRRAGWFN